MEQEILSIILNSLLSIIAIIISIISLIYLNKQIKLSNKQSLFKDRVHAFATLKNMFDLYKKNKKIDKSVIEFPKFMFCLLTGNKFLEDTMEIMDKPLNDKEQNNFLGKMEDLMSTALQIELLWGNEESKIASSFVLKYVDLLCSLYSQHIYVLKLESRKECDLEEFKKLIFKKAEDIGLLKNIEEIRFFYNQIKEKKVLEKLKEQIKLK